MHAFLLPYVGVSQMSPSSLWHVNTWFLVGGPVLGGLGAVALLEEVTVARLAEFKGSGIPTFSLLPTSGFRRELSAVPAATYSYLIDQKSKYTLSSISCLDHGVLPQQQNSN